MTRFAIAAALLAATLWLEWGWVAPSRRAAGLAAAEYREARAAQQEARAGLRQRREQEARVRRAEALLEAGGDRSGDASLAQLRARTLRALEGRPLDDVRLQVRAQREGGDGLLFLTAAGGHQDLLRLPGELVRDEPGLVLQRVSLRANPAGELALDVQARWATRLP